MQYLVPHFLETEQRVIGPFTFHKFIVAIGVGGFLFILYYSGIGLVAWLATTIVIGGATLVLMFGSYNGRPYTHVLVDVIKRLFRPANYTWGESAQNENVSDYLLNKEKMRSLSREETPKKENEKPLSQRIEEMSKTLDEKNV